MNSVRYVKIEGGKITMLAYSLQRIHKPYWYEVPEFFPGKVGDSAYIDNGTVKIGELITDTPDKGITSSGVEETTLPAGAKIILPGGEETAADQDPVEETTDDLPPSDDTPLPSGEEITKGTAVDQAPEIDQEKNNYGSVDMDEAAGSGDELAGF